MYDKFIYDSFIKLLEATTKSSSSDWLSIISLGIALLSLLISFSSFLYNLIKKTDIVTSVDGITFIQIPEDNKVLLMKEMMKVEYNINHRIPAHMEECFKDSYVKQNPNPTTEDNYLGFGQFIDKFILNGFEKEFQDIIEGLESENVLKYNPPDEIISNFYTHPLFTNSIYIPVTIFNRGRKEMIVNSLTMIIKDELSNHKRFYFAIAEANQESFRPGEHIYKDHINGFFNGGIVEGVNKLLLHPVFIIHDVNDKEVKNLEPLKIYKCKIFGFSSASRNKPIFETREFDIVLNGSDLLKTFKGGSMSQKFGASDYFEASISNYN